MFVNTKRISKFNHQSKAVDAFIESDTKRSSLWAHQVDAIKAIRDHTQTEIALCVLPTGAGKSGIAVLSAYACDAECVLVITPSKHISEQMFDSFCHKTDSFMLKKKVVLNIDEFERNCRPSCKGVMKKTTEINSYFNDYDLIIANAQKFGSNSRVSIDQIPNKDVDLVIVDEAHHYPADTWKTIIDHFENAKKIFLTATPTNGGKDILADQSSHLCYSLRRAELVLRGIIRNIYFNEDAKSDNEREAFQVFVL